MRHAGRLLAVFVLVALWFPSTVPAVDRRLLAEAEQVYQEARIALEQVNPNYELKFRRAIKLLERALEQGVERARVLRLLGSAHLYLGDEKDLGKARAYLEKSLALETDKWALFWLAQVHGLEGDKEREIEHYEKALELDPRWAECHFWLALAYDRSKRPDAARKTFEHAKAAIRERPEYKRKFQGSLKTSEVAKQIGSIVSEIIEKSEEDHLTDEQTERYARKFEQMLGAKTLSISALRDEGRMRALLESARKGPVEGTRAPRAGVPDAEVRGASGDAHEAIVENPFLRSTSDPLSTFSIDVDTASYAILRRHLREGSRPPVDAVRIEEMINSFRYDYPPPDAGETLTVHAEVASCPWTPAHRLLKIGLKGKEIDADKRKDANLVFLIDVSGSMNAPDRLPLVKRSLSLLLPSLRARDRVSIVVYAGAVGLVLPPTPGDRATQIRDALDRLAAGGSTNGGQGLALAYKTARDAFLEDGSNRVILATDGDFNVGMTSREQLVQYVTEQAKGGVFLTVLGYGRGNLKDATIEQLADKGNGNYAYIDSIKEARKVLVEQAGGTLEAIAKDVKLQIEFNPALVAGYRLIGYENRMLAARDFNDDTKDAGELGAGHTVTALYELVPAGQPVPGGQAPGQVDPLRYQTTTPARSGGGELLTVKLRYKQPREDKSRLLEFHVGDTTTPFDKASVDMRFAASVAAFGMLLRNSPHKGAVTFDMIATLSESALGRDPGGYRAEFVELVTRARTYIK